MPAASPPGPGSGARCWCAWRVGRAWPEAADVSLTVAATAWEGLGQGHGHLRARRVVVEAAGRRGADRPRRAELWLPGPGGVLAAAPPTPSPRCGRRVPPPVPDPHRVVTAPSGTLVLHVAPDWPVVAAGAAPDEPAAVVSSPTGWWPPPRRPGPTGVEVGHAPAGVPGPLPRRWPSSTTTPPATPGPSSRWWRRWPSASPPASRWSPPATLAFATRGPSRYFGGDAALAAARRRPGRRGAADAGPSPASGIADGPFAALLAALAARAGTGPPSWRRSAAPRFLAPQPVDALALAGVDRRAASTCSAAWACAPSAPWPPSTPATSPAGSAPTASPPTAWPPGATSGRRLATPPPPDLAAAIELDPPAERVETAAFVARALADELAGRLDADGLACTRLLVAAETEHGERLERLWRGDGAGRGLRAHRRRHRRPASAGSSRAGSRTAGASRPTAGISLLELVPDEVVPATGRQLGFWGGTAGADERAVRAVARVAGLLGLEAVTRARVAGRAVAGRAGGAGAGGRRRPRRGRGPRPGRRTRHPAAPGREGPPPWPGALPAPAPAVADRLPVRCRTREVLAAGGRPGAASTAGARSAAAPARVAGRRGAWRWAGPWPVEERWWDPAGPGAGPASRSSTADGVARLLALEGGRWWVEAVYD